MSEVLVSILNGLLWVTSLPSHVPVEAWALLSSALGVSVVMQGLKHWIDDVIDPRWIIFLTTLLSTIAACLVFVINGLTQNPMILGSDTATILGIATLAYRFIVAPSYGFLIDIREYQANKKGAKLSDAVENEIKSIDANKVLETPKVNPLIADDFEG